MDHVWLTFVFRFNHRENFMKDLAKMANKRRWRWEKRGFGGKVLWNHIILRKKGFDMQNSYGQKKGPRPLVNTNDSWCCKWTGNCENAATRRFFERSLMDQCASLPGSLLAPVPSFWDTLRYQDKTCWPCWPILFSKRNNSKVYKFHYFSKTINFTIFLRITIYYEPCLTGDYSHVGGLNHWNQPSLSWTVPLFWDSCPDPKHPSSDIAVRSVNFTTQVRYTPRIMTVVHAKWW